MSVTVGSILNGKVTGITKFGAFVSLETGDSGMVHISEVANEYITEIRDHLSEGQQVRVKVLNIDEKNRINLSIKKAVPASAPAPVPEPGKQASRSGASFEDMLSKFKQQSEERFSDTKVDKELRKSNYKRRQK